MQALAAALALAACSAVAPSGREAAERRLSEEYGLAPSQLLRNGLSERGLTTAAFQNWFNRDTVLGDTLMQFLVRCAVAPEQSRSWTNPATGAVYRWAGLLGLAPDWAGGSPATAGEQKAMAACLAAHVKKFGVACKAPPREGAGFRGGCLAHLRTPVGNGLQAGAGGETALHAARPDG